ncbi:hypothetical protein AbraIFM66951_011209 [Aspergillus brasiliensis]|uniref:Uncharacterized protein n=2 Tax=Aspergillus brasiliensis TaxID=319629 RepID=A0A1L9V189_ASPBC|nr:hypothetical protein ASPBRDRAFT_190980 [Aspergillus brasiliensis CBS 101740]GKZ25544.1 hypothetical protein AbraCBS73388_001185 [Aspergillus brasiliensis]GKZ47651.1 hypothetical protein AbraIFM66951_011209 [Aspergillus brasiliensis]
MAPLGETIAVIDKSGKVVSTSKHLFGVFSQAKNAYRERKAQFQSERNAKIAEKEALRALENYHIDDAPSVASSRRSRSRYHSGRSHYAREPSVYEEDVQWQDPYADPYGGRPGEMVRRHTHDVAMRGPERPTTSRSKSDAHVDMDLAYGDFHPSALEKVPPPPEPQNQLQRIENPELNTLVDRAQWLLEEADCMQHTATATIAHLQKNPDAMAAVALTLAEISNIATKMAPSALSTLKAAAPTVFALLASPQFLIAAGVGIGVTIVMFGGYKIVKQIQNATNATPNSPMRAAAAPEEEDPGMDDMMEFNTECLSSVEMWRRGVADAEAGSVGTSVDGEFITPKAAAMSGIDVTTARMSRDPRFKFDDDDQSMASSRRSRRSRSHREGSHAHHRPESHVSSRAPSKVFSKAPSKAPSRAPSYAPSRAESRYSDMEPKPKEKKKRSSRLRLMFTA